MVLQMVRNIKHGEKRSKERFGVGVAEGLGGMVNNAIKYGQNYSDFPQETKLHQFLLSKHLAANKRVKLYKGKVFIIFRTTPNLITCYELPEELKEEYEKYKKIMNV